VRRPRQGFTLIELLVTIAVAVILLLIGVPSFQQIIANNRMAADVNSLVTALNLARSEAIKRGVSVTACQSNNSTSATPACSDASDWEAGWMVFVDNNNDGVCADTDSDGMCDTGGGQILRVWEPLRSGQTLTGQAGATSVTYSALGVNAPLGTSDNFQLSDPALSDARIVMVSSGGRVTSCTVPASETTCP